MKKLLYLFFLAPIFAYGQTAIEEKGIFFEKGTFSEIMAKAKKENKLIFVDAYTTWCGPCKWMAKNTFLNDTAAEFYNKNFINAKIDVEKGEGVGIAKKYEVMCYPTLLYIDGSGKLLHRQSSALDSKEFIKLGTEAMNPAMQFASYKKKYDSGTSTPDEMGEYVLMRGRSCLSVKDEMAKYFNTQTDADLTSERNWKIINGCIMNISGDSREFNYLIEHRLDYEKLYGSEKVNEVVIGMYSFALDNYIKEKNIDGYKKLKEGLINKRFSFSDDLALGYDMELYFALKDWDNYAKTAVIYVDKVLKEDYSEKNNIVWNFYENITDKTMLAKAEQWIRESIALKPGYFNYDTYSALLYKLGKKPEAQAAAEKAIEFAKKDGEDYKETELLLEKIKAMK